MVEASTDESLSDEMLLARIAGRDRHAFTMLMRRHGRRVRGLALAFTGKPEEADDITQDVFLLLWRKPEAWKPGPAAFSTWLYRVVANRCLDHARRARLRRWLPFGEAVEPPDDSPGAHEALAGRDHLAKVTRMIRALPERQRIALLLSAQDDKSNAEIAAILEISEGAAEQLLVRARRALRAMIQDRES